MQGLLRDDVFGWLVKSLEEYAKQADVKIKTAPTDLAAIVEREQQIGFERGLKQLALLVGETLKHTNPNE